jgi:hypothetical protein
MSIIEILLVYLRPSYIEACLGSGSRNRPNSLVIIPLSAIYLFDTTLVEFPVTTTKNELVAKSDTSDTARIREP